MTKQEFEELKQKSETDIQATPIYVGAYDYSIVGIDGDSIIVKEPGSHPVKLNYSQVLLTPPIFPII